MDVVQDRRFIIDRVGEEIDLEECSLCFASSCFSCVSDHCTALKKLSDGDCVFYKDHEEDHKEIWRCFYRLIRCQRFDLLMRYADTLAALDLMDQKIAMAESEHERLEEHRLTHLKELTDQNWKDSLVVIYPKDEEDEPDGEEEEPTEAPSVPADPEAVFDNSMDALEIPVDITDTAIDDETAEGLSVHAHSVGDAATRFMLDCIEDAQIEFGKLANMTVFDCDFLHDDLGKVAKAKVVATIVDGEEVYKA